MRHALLNATLALALAASGNATHASALNVKVYQADENSFNVNSTLLYGEHEAVVFDGGFTRADGLRIAANVLDTGRTLTTIVVSQADPDYYFGVEAIKSIFPNARVVASPEVIATIQAKLPTKLGFWGPKLGANAPVHPVIPEPLPARLTVDGEVIELRGNHGALAHRPYYWVPSLHAIVGSIAVFNDMHVWLADTPTEAQQSAWLKQLDEMQSLKPALVVPGHSAKAAAFDTTAIDFTRRYLHDFRSETHSATQSGKLIEAMEQRYPKAVGKISLDIGAKVIKGEMPW